MFKILGYGIKCAGKAINSPPVKAALKTYAFARCSSKGLDLATICLYKDVYKIAIKDGVKFSIYNIRKVVANFKA